jgi:hypothetical protein
LLTCRFLPILFATWLLTSCTGPDPLAPRQIDAGTALPVMITGVTVVDTHTGKLTANQSILISGGRIQSVTESIPADSNELEIIDASGKYAVPGFVNSHVHVLGEPDLEQSMALMLANGVTGFRQMRGSPEILALKQTGELPIGNDEPAPLWVPGDLMTPINTRSKELTLQTIRQQHNDGADFIKLGMVSAEMLEVILEETRKLGTTAAGHLPSGTDSIHAATQGIAAIEHLGTGLSMLVSCSSREAELRAMAPAPPGLLNSPIIALPFAGKIFDLVLPKLLINPVMLSSPEEFERMRAITDSFDEARCRSFAEAHASTNTWQVPTLQRLRAQYYADSSELVNDPNNRFIDPDRQAAIMDMVHNFSEMMTPDKKSAMEAVYQKNLRLVKILDEAGVKMLTGSDGGPGQVGYGLHQEFDELTKAGISPLRILQMATLNPAEFLTRTADHGSIEQGKIADLVLLDGDPTRDSENLHRIHGVMRGGFYYHRNGLDALIVHAETFHKTTKK